jgi:hypothetical protein
VNVTILGQTIDAKVGYNERIAAPSAELKSPSKWLSDGDMAVVDARIAAEALEDANKNSAEASDHSTSKEEESRNEMDKLDQE